MPFNVHIAYESEGKVEIETLSSNCKLSDNLNDRRIYRHTNQCFACLFNGENKHIDRSNNIYFCTIRNFRKCPYTLQEKAENEMAIACNGDNQE